MTKLPKLPMLVPCNHIRKDEANRYRCAVLGECVPITKGPDLSACPSFSPNGKPVVKQGSPPRKIATQAKAKPAPRSACQHRGESTGKLATCSTCRGKVQLKVFTCPIHKECTVAKQGDDKSVACCQTCKEYAPCP